VDQDQLNPYVANEGYVVRVPHNPHHLPSRRALDNYTLILTVNTPSIHFFPTDNNV
jgi:hypothetical protein